MGGAEARCTALADDRDDRRRHARHAEKETP
jgi:hypothetical protein